MTGTPPVYFPIERRTYDVSPGLRPLGFDFGNGIQDSKVFQIDDQWPRYRAEKLASRQEMLSKYHAVSELDPLTQKTAVLKIIELLLSEWPQHFENSDDSLGTNDSQSATRLVCLLTGETLIFDSSARLVDVIGGPTPRYVNAFDALLSQVQEDAALISVRDGNWLSMLHVLLPSHWDPREKIGHDFAKFHEHIPGFEKMAKIQHQIVDAMIHKGPFTRFVWSFVTDRRLNHHPEPPEGSDEITWRGRTFDSSAESPFSLRIERQTIVGLPSASASLFLIRLSFIDGLSLKNNSIQRDQLVGALESMSPAARGYKGVLNCFGELVSWLNQS